MSTEPITYAASGVDREKRKAAKDFSLFQKGLKGALQTPYLSLQCQSGKCSALLADGVGTKVLLAQLAGKHDTVGIDGVAMVANDAARAGLSPKFLVDIIDLHHSDEELVAQLVRGIYRGAKLAGCAVVGGETADVPELVTGIGGNPYNLNFSLYAKSDEGDVIRGTGLRPGDVILGLQSSGLHSNGFSLVRRILFKQWGGYYGDPFAAVDGLDKPLIDECLAPTRIYARGICDYQSKVRTIKAAVHVTGDAYAKFGKLFAFNKGIGLDFSIFKPQPIFSVLQATAKKLGKTIADGEMLKTFNMGWGFALIVAKADADAAESYFSSKGIPCGQIGIVTQKEGRIAAQFAGKEVVIEAGRI